MMFRKVSKGNTRGRGMGMKTVSNVVRSVLVSQKLEHKKRTKSNRKSALALNVSVRSQSSEKWWRIATPITSIQDWKPKPPIVVAKTNKKVVLRIVAPVKGNSSVRSHIVKHGILGCVSRDLSRMLQGGSPARLEWCPWSTTCSSRDGMQTEEVALDKLSESTSYTFFHAIRCDNSCCSFSDAVVATTSSSDYESMGLGSWSTEDIDGGTTTNIQVEEEQQQEQQEQKQKQHANNGILKMHTNGMTKHYMSNSSAPSSITTTTSTTNGTNGTNNNIIATSLKFSLSSVSGASAVRNKWSKVQHMKSFVNLLRKPQLDFFRKEKEKLKRARKRGVQTSREVVSVSSPELMLLG